MTDNITIPPEALEAVAKEIASKIYNANWDILTAQMRQECYVFARAACRAMLKAWPGAGIDRHLLEAIILPLPTEKSNVEV